MAFGPEALSYFLKLREDFPATLPRTPEGVITDVVNFCKNGLPHRPGTTPIPGTINWLIGLRVKKANFYTAKTPVPMLFCLLSENTSSNWTLLPRFMDFVETNPVILNPGDITLTSQTELDEIFLQRRPQTDTIPISRRLDLLAALRGEEDLTETLKWIDELNQAEGIAEISSFF